MWPGLRGSRHEISGHHQCLFVGQCHSLTGLKRGKRGLQTGCTYDRVHHDVSIRMGGGLDEDLGPGGPARVATHSGKSGVGGPPLRDLRLQLLPVLSGGQGDQAEVLLLPPEHIQGAPANRAGRAQESHAPPSAGRGHQITPKARYIAAAVGMTK